MRKAFAVLANLLLLVVVAEFFFAASGGAGGTYRPHHALGYVIFLLPLVMAAVAALAHLPGRLIGMAALVSGLTGVQVAIAKIAAAADSPVVFGLHALGGLGIVAVAFLIARQGIAIAK